MPLCLTSEFCMLLLIFAYIVRTAPFTYRCFWEYPQKMLVCKHWKRSLLRRCRNSLALRELAKRLKGLPHLLSCTLCPLLCYPLISLQYPLTRSSLMSSSLRLIRLPLSPPILQVKHQPTVKKPCYNCGLNHPYSQCPARGQKCLKWQKKNLYSVCRSSSASSSVPKAAALVCFSYGDSTDEESRVLQDSRSVRSVSHICPVSVSIGSVEDKSSTIQVKVSSPGIMNHWSLLRHLIQELSSRWLG